MKVRFLGTGAAEGMPALFCDCEICAAGRRLGGPDRRFRASVLIDDAIRIDLPPDALAQAHANPELPLHAIRHLLFTHTHDDHFAARELQYLSPTFAPCRKQPLDIWGTDYLLNLLTQKTERFFEPIPAQLHAVEPFQTYAVDHLRVTPITAHHKEDELCLNYLVTEAATDRTVLYASDTGWYDAPTWEFLSGRALDTVILECGLGVAAGGYEGHLSLSGCIAAREKLVAAGGLSEDAPFYLTHVSHTGLLLHSQLSDRAAPHGITIAYDGLEISV